MANGNVQGFLFGLSYDAGNSKLGFLQMTVDILKKKFLIMFLFYWSPMFWSKLKVNMQYQRETVNDKSIILTRLVR